MNSSLTLRPRALLWGEPEMMRIRRPSAKVLGDRSNMIPVTQAARFGHRQHALVDRVGAFSLVRF